LGNTGTMLLFIPGFTILAFIVGSIIAFIAMSDRVDPNDDDGDAEAAH
jgi:hypothetical protein